MASLNKNIQTGNFIPGSEEYTRPEEIAIMGKYLRAGIQSLNEDIELPTTDSSDTSGKARLVKVKELNMIYQNRLKIENIIKDNTKEELRELRKLFK